MSELSVRIKEMRKKRRLTLLEVAEYLGVKEATAQRYESGSIKNIKHETICKLAELFDCDPRYLMGWKEDYKKENSPNELKLTEGEAMLLEMFRQIPEDAQKMYLEVLRASLKNQP